MALEQDSKALQENSVLEAEKSLAPEKSSRFEWYYSGSRFRIYSMPSMLFSPLVHNAGSGPFFNRFATPFNHK